MKKIDRVIGIFSLILILSIIVIIYLINSLKNKSNNTDNNQKIVENQTPYNQIENVEEKKDIRKNKFNASTFLRIYTAVDTFFGYANGTHSGILFLIDDAYLSKYNIKKETLETYAESGANVTTLLESSFNPIEKEFNEIMNNFGIANKKFNYSILENAEIVLNENNFISAKCNVIVKPENDSVKRYVLIVNFDIEKNTFSVIPEKDFNANEITKSIKSYSVNYIFIPSDPKELTARKLLSYFANTTNNVPYSYSLLNKTYKDEKYNSIEKYNKYIENNKQFFKNMYLNKYFVTEGSDYIEYICTDQLNNFYTFKMKGLTDFEIMLDEYTILAEEEKEYYEKLNEESKAIYDVNRFIGALKDDEYAVAYKFLNQDFKSNYFKTKEEFEKYMQKDNDIIKYAAITEQTAMKEGELYIVDILFEKGSSRGENDIKLKKTFIVKLNEDTDFELSFNVE